MLVIGLTGGIGSGKTTVSQLFERLGVTVADADEISRKATATGGFAIEQIQEAFGQDAIQADGAMNRAWMREKVFADEKARHTLTGILHPAIQTEMLRQLRQATSAYAIASVPLLVESDFWLRMVDRVLVVDVPVSLQIERVKQRSGLTEAQVLKIIQAQASRKARLEAADDVIVNTCGLAELAQAVTKLHDFYLDLT